MANVRVLKAFKTPTHSFEPVSSDPKVLAKDPGIPSSEVDGPLTVEDWVSHGFLEKLPEGWTPPAEEPPAPPPPAPEPAPEPEPHAEQ